MKVRKTAAVTLGTFMILSNGISVYAKENTSAVNVTNAYTENLEKTIDTVSDVIQNNLDSIKIDTPEPVEEVSYTYVEQDVPVYTNTVTETVSEPITMSVDEFMEVYGQDEEAVSVDTSALQAAYDAALVNYNAALAEYEAASQMIETTKEVEVEVVDESIDDEGNIVETTHIETQTVVEMVPAVDISIAEANLDGAKVALDESEANLNAVLNTAEDQIEKTVEVEETVTEEVQNANEGDNLSWTLDNTGLLIISGTGDMQNYTSTLPWGNGVTRVIVQDGVTSIGNNVFNNCRGLYEVTLADSITRIGEYAFYNTIISSISLPNKLTEISVDTFAQCKQLESITIPSTVTTINNYAFIGCTSLKEVNLLSGLTSIGNGAFNDCKSLEYVYIPDTVTTIGSNAFSNCTGLQSVSLSNNLKTIDPYAFHKCSGLTSVMIPGSVTTIGHYAFLECTSLSEVILPDSVTAIGPHSFRDCTSLTEIKLPKNLVVVSIFAFAGCTSLTSITIPDSVQLIDSSAFMGCTSLESVVLPSEIDRIGVEMFNGCTGLKNIEIPESVTTIDANAFKDCVSLESLYLSEAVTAIHDAAFDGCSNLTLTVYEDSYALNYAIEHNIPYIILYHVSGVSLDKEEAFIVVGEQMTLKAQTVPSDAKNQNMTWKSSDESIARVVDGVVTGISSGIAAITVTTEEGNYTADCIVTVVDNPVMEVRHTLSLEGDIGVNFYFLFTDSLKQDHDAKVEFTINGNTTSHPISYGDVTDRYLRFSAQVTSIQMTTPILAKVISSTGEEIYSETYTVKDYCDSKLSDPSIDAKLKTLLESLLNFGGYAQIQFNTNTDHLANEDLADTDVSDVTKEMLASYASVKTGSMEGIKLAGSTLILDSYTSIRHYFALEDGHSISEYKFKMGDSILFPVQSGNLYYVTIPVVASYNLDVMYSVSVGDFTVKYGALSYAYNQLNKTASKDTLKNACRALYKYNVAANAYFEA